MSRRQKAMAANLTPQYYKAEEAYRKAQSSQERITTLLEVLRVIPKHKGTDHLQGALRAKLREAREAYQRELKAPKGGRSWKIPRQGVATVVVIGAPNSGKSRLVAELTNASPNVADYPYSTNEPLAGMLDYEGVAIQLVDTPPISESFFETYLNDFVRTADLVLLCFDGSSDDAPQQTVDVLEQLENRKTHLSATSGFDKNDYSITKVKSRLIVTRSDVQDSALRIEMLSEIVKLEMPLHQCELDKPANVGSLGKLIFESLDFIRIYTKKPGCPVEYVDPYVIPIGGTVEELAGRVHEELASTLKFAKVQSVNEDDAHTVGRTYVLNDLDIVELHV
ncbi:50S ribosome-binding GTPase [bacterium]|nr:50S ribosome-binding GTPase [bacterium]MDB4731742.1 50S ribosome-binding GTPase [bacterium]